LGRVTNLALCATVNHSKPRPVSDCQAQQTSPCAPLLGTTNLALCPTVTARHSKPRCTPHCQSQQISPCVRLSATANLTLCPTAKHNKPRPVPHCQAQEISPRVLSPSEFSVMSSQSHVLHCRVLPPGEFKIIHVIPEPRAFPRYSDENPRNRRFKGLARTSGPLGSVVLYLVVKN